MRPWANRGRTATVCAPHKPNRGVAVRFLRQTEPWDVARFGLCREPNRTVRGSNRGQHYQCSEPIQTVKHLLLGCPIYREEKERAGILRETTLQSLLFSQKGSAALIDFIQETGIATRKWLLQGGSNREEEDNWGWGSLREMQDRDGEETL